MIVAFSTSSPIASVALFTREGDRLGSAGRETDRRAGEACLELLDLMLAKLDRALGEAEGFVCDLGPGGFTSVRVGVMLAKSMAYAHGVRCAGASAFDLIDPAGPVFVPTRKGLWLLREPGKPPVPVTERPSKAKGYGGDGDVVLPSAAKFEALLPTLRWVSPEELMPEYHMEPSISTPKTPFPTR